MNNINEYIQEKLVINKHIGPIKNNKITHENFNEFVHELLINEYGLKTNNFITTTNERIGHLYIKKKELQKYKIDIEDIINDINQNSSQRSICKCDYNSSSEMYNITLEY